MVLEGGIIFFAVFTISAHAQRQTFLEAAVLTTVAVGPVD